ncbi:hypothetical protein N7493_007430 [Penicillium malachiteum]|uniref:Uncharacterized protein n=1 Tax=Penicillium malachiteum TaxID=1324776 RepID=A0AAD6MU04_9EURO|nr:hypothetical protein N7493_007430 [Penicillium malachiteum]
MAVKDSENVMVDKTSHPGITIVSINRPERRNAVDPATAKRLYEAILNFESDTTQKVCVLTGTGGNFCSGADLHQVAQKQNEPGENLQPVNQRNLELSLLADIRIVEEDAIFGVFCRRWGVPLIDGGTVRLQAIVGLGRAMDMILTGRPVNANEALTMGLANRVVPKGESLNCALEIARQLMSFPDLCLNTDRRSCYYSTYEARSFEDALSQEFKAGERVISAEGIQGAGRFSKGSGRHSSFETSKL